MQVPSKFTTAVLALFSAQPVLSANWAAEAGKISDSVAVSNGDDNVVDLPRVLHGRSRWRVREEVVEVRATEAESKSKSEDTDSDTTSNSDTTSDSDATSDVDTTNNDDSNAGDVKTTLSTSITSTSLAAMTSPNTWVMVEHVTGTSYSTITCMTPTAVATKACSYINDKTTTCAATTAVVPTCVAGLMCSFADDTGSVSCVTKGGMHPSGFIVVGVLGLAVTVATTATSLMCCRDHRSRKAMKKAAEVRAAMLAAAEVKKAPRAEVSEVGAEGGDHVPLMSAGPNTFAAIRVPGIAQEQRYGDPFEDGHGHYGSSG